MRNEVARSVLDEECIDTLTTPDSTRFLLAVLISELEKSGYLLNLVRDYLPHLSDQDWLEEARLRLVLTVRTHANHNDMLYTMSRDVVSSCLHVALPTPHAQALKHLRSLPWFAVQ